jgi:hypothetical protein
LARLVLPPLSGRQDSESGMSFRAALLLLSPRVRRVFGLPVKPLTETEQMFRVIGRRGYIADVPLPRERAIVRGKRRR